MWKVDCEIAEPIIYGSITRHHTVLHQAIRSSVYVNG